MKLFFYLTALIALFSTSSFASLNCKDTRSLKEVENVKIRKSDIKKIVRAAVSDLYGTCGRTSNPDYCYNPRMSYQEVVDLGEDAYTTAYVSESGKIYYGAVVGFGGGNSAVYYFKSRNLKMQKIMTVDGTDCTPIQSLLGY